MKQNYKRQYIGFVIRHHGQFPLSKLSLCKEILIAFTLRMFQHTGADIVVWYFMPQIVNIFVSCIIMESIFVCNYIFSQHCSNDFLYSFIFIDFWGLADLFLFITTKKKKVCHLSRFTLMVLYVMHMHILNSILLVLSLQSVCVRKMNWCDIHISYNGPQPCFFPA